MVWHPKNKITVFLVDSTLSECHALLHKGITKIIRAVKVLFQRIKSLVNCSFWYFGDLLLFAFVILLLLQDYKDQKLSEWQFFANKIPDATPPLCARHNVLWIRMMITILRVYSVQSEISFSKDYYKLYLWYIFIPLQSLCSDFLWLIKPRVISFADNNPYIVRRRRPQYIQLSEIHYCTLSRYFSELTKPVQNYLLSNVIFAHTSIRTFCIWEDSFAFIIGDMSYTLIFLIVTRGIVWRMGIK